MRRLEGTGHWARPCLPLLSMELALVVAGAEMACERVERSCLVSLTLSRLVSGQELPGTVRFGAFCLIQSLADYSTEAASETGLLRAVKSRSRQHCRALMLNAYSHAGNWTEQATVPSDLLMSSWHEFASSLQHFASHPILIVSSCLPLCSPESSFTSVCCRVSFHDAH